MLSENRCGSSLIMKLLSDS